LGISIISVFSTPENTTAGSSGVSFSSLSVDSGSGASDEEAGGVLLLEEEGVGMGMGCGIKEGVEDEETAELLLAGEKAELLSLVLLAALEEDALSTGAEELCGTEETGALCGAGGCTMGVLSLLGGGSFSPPVA
jgi:hypothetical protein